MKVESGFSLPSIKGPKRENHFGTGRKERKLESNLDSEYASGGRLDVAPVKKRELGKSDLTKYYKRNHVNETYIRNDIGTGNLL